MPGDTEATSRFPKNVDTVRVSTKGSDVVSGPLQRSSLVLKGGITCAVVWIFFLQAVNRSKAEYTKACKMKTEIIAALTPRSQNSVRLLFLTIVRSYNNHIPILGQLLSVVKAQFITVTNNVTATKDPKHNRQARTGCGVFRRPI